MDDGVISMMLEDMEKICQMMQNSSGKDKEYWESQAVKALPIAVAKIKFLNEFLRSSLIRCEVSDHPTWKKVEEHDV